MHRRFASILNLSERAYASLTPRGLGGSFYPSALHPLDVAQKDRSGARLKRVTKDFAKGMKNHMNVKKDIV
jgi:hypothetical protein